jgi:hypothetical protein
MMKKIKMQTKIDKQIEIMNNTMLMLMLMLMSTLIWLKSFDSRH